jgi:hypothetical protein
MFIYGVGVYKQLFGSRIKVISLYFFIFNVEIKTLMPAGLEITGRKDTKCVCFFIWRLKIDM